MTTTKVLVVDDHPVARRGIATLITEAFPDHVLRQAGSTSDAINTATTFQPHLVVLDLRTPDPPGPATTCAILRDRNPHGHIVLLTAFAAVEIIRHCLASGADGVLLKDTEPGELVDRLRDITTGTKVVDPRIGELLAGDLVSMLRGETKHVGLSRREREVLELLSEGCSNRQIADRLHIAETTVKGYVAALFSKLEVKSRLQAVVHATQQGLL